METLNPNMASDAPPVPPGKRRLMAAALRLAARSRSLHALGLRELAREANLNPNTFYRHFNNLDELGKAIIDELVLGLRQPLRNQRFQAALAAEKQKSDAAQAQSGFQLERAKRVTRETVALFFDYVLAHPDGFILGVRELHGSSPTLRRALRQAMSDFARDMAEDSRALAMAPRHGDDIVDAIAITIVRQMFELSLDYLEYPEQRDQTREQAEVMILTLFAGSFALSKR